jgi:hypothetical protein
VSKIRKYDGQLVLAVGDLITHQQTSTSLLSGLLDVHSRIRDIWSLTPKGI